MAARAGSATAPWVTPDPTRPPPRMPSDTEPRIDTRQTADGAAAVLRGEWTAARLTAGKTWRGISAALGATGTAAAWDLRGLDALDHLGALTLWNHWGQQWPARLEVDDGQRALLERVAAYPAVAPARKRLGWAQRVDALGVRVLQSAAQVRDFVTLMGQLLLDFLRLLGRPDKGPWRDFSGNLFSIGAKALPITALVGFLIGVVLAYLMSLQLRQFGAEAFIVNILGISLIREIGPLLGAILVAGRSGSAITAQIGVMRVTEELDAMRVMGIAHGFRQVMPRALALAVAMPLIALWTTLAALAGGMLAADLTMGISAAYFLQVLPAAVQVSNLWLAMAKSVVFGVFIALIGCHWGLRVKPNTQSLGEGTTAAVVSAITMVIIVDAVFAVAFRSVGF